MVGLEHLISQVLDNKYQINKKLGQGGMGAVFLATHLGTTRPVAIKIISPQLMKSDEFVERFKREAEAAGRLRHTNVVNVTDFGFADVKLGKVAYLVMEYLDGCTLGDLLREKRPLPTGLIIDIVEQTGLAIDEAHRQGIIHRDLKPDNIWLEPDGRGGNNVKVLDFGLVKLYNPNDKVIESPSITNPELINNQPSSKSLANTLRTGVPSSFPDFEAATQINIRNNPIILDTNNSIQATKELNTGANLTDVNAILGTPLYMSPEQCAGEELGPGSDIYSLGIIVYQMFAGETPFNGDMLKLMAQHIDKQPMPLITKRPDLPKSVAALVMTALAKTPAKRPQSAKAFAIGLRTNAEGEAPLLAQANEMYINNRRVFALFTLITHIPIIFLNLILLWINNGFLLTILPLQLFANTLNIAACAQVIEQLHLYPESSIKVLAIIKKLIYQIPELLKTSLHSSVIILARSIWFILPGLKAYKSHSLYAPIVMLESVQGQAAVRRSSKLAANFPYLSGALELHNFVIALMNLMIFLLWTVTDITGSMVIHLYFLMFASVIPLLLSLKHSSCAIAIVLLYNKAKEVSGESFSELVKPQVTHTERVGQPKVSYKKTILPLTKLIIEQLVVALSLIVVAFVLVFAVQSIFNFGILISAVEDGHVNSVKEILSSKVNINERDLMDNQTALIHAARHGQLEIVKLLLKSNPDIDAKDSEGKTALLWAAERGHIKTAKVLIEAGANINEKDNNGRTALINGTLQGYDEIVKLLLKTRIDVNAKDNFGKSALNYASDMSRMEIIESLKSVSGDWR